MRPHRSGSSGTHDSTCPSATMTLTICMCYGNKENFAYYCIMITQTHPAYTAYRSLFTAFLTYVGFSPYLQHHIGISGAICMFLFDTVLLLYPPLFRTDLMVHHLFNIFFMFCWQVTDLSLASGTSVLVAESMSIFNFLRKSRPQFVTLWRAGVVVFIRIPKWVWLFQLNHWLTTTMFVFFMCYDMFLLKQLLPQVRRILR